jgi:hypothetical protein
MPKYRNFPEWTTDHDDYVAEWFDNKQYSWQYSGNVLYLQSGNYGSDTNGFSIHGWCIPDIGAAIVFCKDGNASDVLKKKGVVHEIGHRFGLSKTVYSYIDAVPSESKRAHDDSSYCIMDYKSFESAYLGEPTEFSVEGLLNGSSLADDSLRTVFDR